MRCFTRIAMAFILTTSVVSLSTAWAENKLAAKWTSKIDADPSKSYPLDKAHGPWMVMVASFHEAGSNTQDNLGKTPLEAAQELVLEFRRLKPPVPAYVYQVKGKNESVKAKDELGREQRMKNMRVIDSVCVLAGNYPSIDDPKAQKTLKFIKQFKPKCLEDGVDYTVSPGRPGPLSKAFMTSNPLLTEEEIQQAKQASDPLLISMNSGEAFSLYENKGKFSLIVARFAGKSVNLVNESEEKAESYFTNGGNDLDQAAISARNLVRALRSRDPVIKDKNAREYEQFAPYCRLDAYIWHDYTSSIVTVGSFESPNDPNIKKYVDLFGPKVSVSESNKQTIDYRYLPVPQESGLMNYVPFEVNMRVMAVPRPTKK